MMLNTNDILQRHMPQIGIICRFDVLLHEKEENEEAEGSKRLEEVELCDLMYINTGLVLQKPL